jgi:hypothetical protein
MVRNIFIGVLTVFLLCVFCHDAALSQEEGEFTYGFVKTKTADSITLEETTFDDATGEEKTVEWVYYVSPETEYENAGSIADIGEGEEIDIEYAEKDGKRMAKYIYVYTLEE